MCLQTRTLHHSEAGLAAIPPMFTRHLVYIRVVPLIEGRLVTFDMGNIRG